jgi:hypothetical protein
VSTINLNVMYEVGYSRALEKPTILVAAHGTTLPFSTRPYRDLMYTDISDLENQLEKEIEDLVRRATCKAQGDGYRPLRPQYTSPSTLWNGPRRAPKMYHLWAAENVPGVGGQLKVCHFR